jgi:glucose-6-phosphate isomerase
MSPVWAVPVLVFAIGGVALVALLKGAAESARELTAELARFGEVQAAVNQVRSGLERGAESAIRLRSTRR